MLLGVIWAETSSQANCPRLDGGSQNAHPEIAERIENLCWRMARGIGALAKRQCDHPIAVSARPDAWLDERVNRVVDLGVMIHRSAASRLLERPDFIS